MVVIKNSLSVLTVVAVVVHEEFEFVNDVSVIIVENLKVLFFYCLFI